MNSKRATSISASHKPTIRDVAREAGVSQTTVSYVLSGSKHAQRIPDDTKARVQSAAERLGYRRDALGTALQRGYSDIVVLLAVTWELASGHAPTMVSLSRAAAARGLSTIVHVAADNGEAIAFLNHVDSLNPYGILLLWDSPAEPESELSRLQQRGIPIVDLLPSNCDEVVSVTSDREQGAHLAVKYLLDLGHSRIGLILDTTSRGRTSSRKLDGYRRALDEAGIGFNPDLLEEVTGFGFDAGYSGALRLLERRPDITAVFCINDPIALGAMRAAEDTGRTVPRDISVIGYGAFVEGTYCRPRLTSVAMSSSIIASESIDILVRMRSDEPQIRHSIALPMELVVRESTGPAPI